MGRRGGHGALNSAVVELGNVAAPPLCDDTCYEAFSESEKSTNRLRASADVQHAPQAGMPWRSGDLVAQCLLGHYWTEELNAPRTVSTDRASCGADRERCHIHRTACSMKHEYADDVFAAARSRKGGDEHTARPSGALDGTQPFIPI